MEDPEPRMRIQAIRASETLYKAGDRSFAADYERMTKDPSVDVVIQAMLTIEPLEGAGRRGDDQGDDGRAIRRAACRSLRSTMLESAGDAGGGGRGRRSRRSSRR